ncbi:hypothetical protein DPEC_G00368100 [Dallia pectoralis]|nr:hypothetical protein DPEC_G00368100 [Dallia pectoralis]
MLAITKNDTTGSQVLKTGKSDISLPARRPRGNGPLKGAEGGRNDCQQAEGVQEDSQEAFWRISQQAGGVQEDSEQSGPCSNEVNLKRD